MEEKAGAQISLRSFVQAALILLVLMLAAGVLTRVAPAGAFTRVEEAGRELIVPGSYQPMPRPDYPVWRWFTAPLEVLGGPDGLTITVIILFILLVGISFAVLDQSGLLRAALSRIVARYGGRKYQLLLFIIFFFMSIGAFFGIFEEVVPLVPLMIALAYYLGWDSLTGLGMSILATNMGFSAAITNPFTLGVAQRLADLPLFSGAWLRVLGFAAIYALTAWFLVRYARRIEADPTRSPVYAADELVRARFSRRQIDGLAGQQTRLGPALTWLAVFLLLIVAALVGAPFIPALSDYALPLVGALFFLAGTGAGLLAGTRGGEIWRAVRDGALGIAPAIPLILMAASVKYIVAQGGILDTLLQAAVGPFTALGPFAAALMIYALALFIEFFIASGSAKAFLIMPILLPLADLVGVTRQVAVSAYIFGDGFSNLAYPTNPVLLICLGLTTVSYPVWLRWTLPLWGLVALATIAFLGLGVAIGYGPF